FSSALELEQTWLGLYTRGNSYIFWPAIFGRTPLGIADLERAVETSKDRPTRPYYARAYAALGDGYWRLGKLDKTREIWKEGLDRFPGDPDLEARFSRQGEELDAYLNANYETSRRVETHLREVWEAEKQAKDAASSELDPADPTESVP
ncbi:MAG: hypothetical protein GY856_20780, partial [bacterium]|nr:hypothetical protein [bacterium]